MLWSLRFHNGSVCRQFIVRLSLSLSVRVTRVQDEADQMLRPVNKDSCSPAPSGEWDKTETGGEAHTQHHSPS